VKFELFKVENFLVRNWLIQFKKIDDFIDEDKKLLLFKGINFDITGHLKNERDIVHVKKRSG